MLLRIASCVGIALCVAGLGTPMLHAEEMAWTVNRYESDVPDEADAVVLSYGIPETDAVAFEAACGGRDGPMPQAVFWYDIVDVPEHEDVTVAFAAGDFAAELPGRVYGKDAEVGISGLQVEIEADAPLWTSMTKSAALAYGVTGGKRESLQLTGAAQAVGDFLSACKAAASSARGKQAASSKVPPPGAAPAGSPGRPATEAVSCDRFGTIRSMASQTPLTVTFVNKSDGYRGLVWIDPEGTPVDNAGLNQGESVTVPTFETHAWMITDDPGNCIEMFVPRDGDTTFEITAPAPAFGPEND